MRVAFVKYSGELNSPPVFGDLTFLLQQMSSTGVQFENQPWDKNDVDWTLYSHVILTSQIEYHDHIDEFIKWVSRMEKLQNPSKMWNSPRVINWNINKKYLLELESKNIRIPATVWLDRRTGIEQMLDVIQEGFRKYDKTVREIVIKNVVSAAGVSVWKCKLNETEEGRNIIDPSDLKMLHQQILSAEGKFGVFVQEFLPNIMIEGEWSLIYFDKVFSHAVLKKPPTKKHNEGANGAEFRVQPYYGGDFTPVPNECVPQVLVEFGNSVLSKVPDRLLHARVDIVTTEDGQPCLMELEVLDALLFLTEQSQASVYLQAIQSINETSEVI